MNKVMERRIELYYDYLHNFLSIEAFAKHYKIHVSKAERFMDTMYVLDNATNGFEKEKLKINEI